MNPLERELASFFAIFILQVGAIAQAKENTSRYLKISLKISQDSMAATT